MDTLKSNVKSTMSRLRTYILSRDLQDIYRFESDSDLPLTHSIKVDFRVFKTAQALNYIDDILPMSSYDRKITLKRMEAGDEVIVGFYQDQPVFYGWLMFDEMEMTYEVYVPASTGTVFAYNLFTKASFRRQGALTQFYHFTRNHLKKKGYDTLYCGIGTNNKASIKGHLKNGFRKCGFFYTLKILGVGFTVADPKYPKRLSINWTKY